MISARLTRPYPSPSFGVRTGSTVGRPGFSSPSLLRRPMKRFCVTVPALLPLFAIALLVASCGPPDPPELVAIAYVRATSEGDPDTAVQLVDIERLTTRVGEEIVVLHSTGSETFLEDSIETLLWGLYRETRVRDFAYNAPPAETEGDTAHVVVTKTPREGEPEEVAVYLRATDRGWRVSGKSLDRLVTYVIQRLQERY